MTASVFIGTSVDGFIARTNGTLDFLPEGGGEPHGLQRVHCQRRCDCDRPQDLRDGSGF